MMSLIADVLENQATWAALENTFWVCLGTTCVSLALGVPLAWILTRTGLFAARSLRTLFCLPYAIPPFIGAIAWINLANPSSGYLNSIFGAGFVNVYTRTGLILVMSSFFYTYVLISVMAALDRMDPSLEEAARISGAGPLGVFFKISLPLLLPALVSGALLVFLASAAAFGIPALIGNPARIYVLTTRIYTYMKMGSLDGIYRAGILSVLLAAAGLILSALSQWAMKSSRFATLSGKTSRPSLIDLGEWKWFVTLVLGILLILVFILPLASIFVSAFSDVPGRIAWDNWSFQYVKHVLTEIDETPRALANSAILSVGAAFVCVVLGVFVAYLLTKTRMKGKSILELLIALPFTVPGSAVALTAIILFSRSISWGDFRISLYGTLWLIGMVYFAKFFNFAVRTTADGFGQIDSVLAEAARVSGASWWTTMIRIWFPLLRPALVASFFLIFMPTFSELTMTVLLTGPGTETIGTLLFQLQSYSDPSGASVLALLIVGIVIASNSLVKLSSRGKYGL